MQQSHEVANSVAAGLGIFTGALIIFAILLIPLIFYCLTLQKALNRCSPECRAMNPPMVWLLLIPLFNIVWQFIVVLNMAKSLGAEFQKRGIAADPNPGQTLGQDRPIACFQVTGPVGLVCWIIYWVKIAGYSNQLAAAPAPGVA